MAQESPHDNDIRPLSRGTRSATVHSVIDRMGLPVGPIVHSSQGTEAQPFGNIYLVLRYQVIGERLLGHLDPVMIVLHVPHLGSL